MSNMILSQVRLNLTTLASSRNILDLVVPTDLTDAARFSNSVFTLAANNNSGNNADSEIALGEVQTFLHLSCSQEVQVTLTREVSSVMVDLPVMVTRHFTITGDFADVVIKNLNTSDPATIKAIYA